MTKSILYGLALVSAATIAVLWAASPGCVGGLCLGFDPRPESPANAPAAQVTAEDLERLWQESSPTAPVSEAAPAGEAGSVAEQARDDAEPALEALDDGSADREREAGVDPAVAAGQAAKAARKWEELASAALSDPDPELRSEAVHEVGLHRSADSVAVLVEVAADDPDPDNRIQALESLWYSAADGLDGDGAIRRTLEAALGDDDEDIAALAEQALADLAKLGQANN